MPPGLLPDATGLCPPSPHTEFIPSRIGLRAPTGGRHGSPTSPRLPPLPTGCVLTRRSMSCSASNVSHVRTPFAFWRFWPKRSAYSRRGYAASTPLLVEVFPIFFRRRVDFFLPIGRSVACERIRGALLGNSLVFRSKEHSQIWRSYWMPFSRACKKPPRRFATFSNPLPSKAQVAR